MFRESKSVINSYRMVPVPDDKWSSTHFFSSLVHKRILLERSESDKGTELDFLC